MERLVLYIIPLVITAVSSWIAAVRMRRKIRKTLGTDISGAELTSLNIWMKVDEIEQQCELSKPIEPR